MLRGYHEVQLHFGLHPIHEGPPPPAHVLMEPASSLNPYAPKYERQKQRESDENEIVLEDSISCRDSSATDHTIITMYSRSNSPDMQILTPVGQKADIGITIDQQDEKKEER